MSYFVCFKTFINNVFKKILAAVDLQQVMEVPSRQQKLRKDQRALFGVWALLD